MDGMIDSPGGLAIQDYKTSDDVIAPEAAMMQVKIYAFGLRLLVKRVSSGGVAYLIDANVAGLSGLTRPKSLTISNLMSISKMRALLSLWLHF